MNNIAGTPVETKRDRERQTSIEDKVPFNYYATVQKPEVRIEEPKGFKIKKVQLRIPPSMKKPEMTVPQPSRNMLHRNRQYSFDDDATISFGQTRTKLARLSRDA